MGCQLVNSVLEIEPIKRSRTLLALLVSCFLNFHGGKFCKSKLNNCLL